MLFTFCNDSGPKCTNVADIEKICNMNFTSKHRLRRSRTSPEKIVVRLGLADPFLGSFSDPAPQPAISAARNASSKNEFCTGDRSTVLLMPKCEHASLNPLVATRSRSSASMRPCLFFVTSCTWLFPSKAHQCRTDESEPSVGC